MKLYDRSGGALQHVRDWRGPRGAITSLSFPLGDAPSAALTSSADGAACFWDARSPAPGPVARFATPGQELCAAACGGAAETLLAAGGEGGVTLWDRRGGGRGAPLATFTEAHGDTVTAAAFHPTLRNVRRAAAAAAAAACAPR